MPDFIHARGTFYAIKSEDDSHYFCSADEAFYSVLKTRYPEQLHIDGVTVCHQASDVSVAEKFRAWLKSGG